MRRFYDGIAVLATTLSLSCSSIQGNLEDMTNSPASTSPVTSTSPSPSSIPRKSEEQLKHVTVNYRLNVKDRDEEGIAKILETLEGVPDPLQKIVNDYGVEVVIFDGPITDNESMKNFKGMQIPKWKKGKTYDILPGVYSISYKEVLIKQNPPPKSHGSVSLADHEYGHAVDHALGDLVGVHEVSSLSYFIKVHEVSRTYKNEDGSLKISDYSYNYRDEFFAESFAKFYFSAETKEKLKEDFPEVYGFLEVMKIKAAEGSFADLKQLNDGSDKPNGVKYQKRYTSKGKCVIY